jgi:HD-like signal output (HDOD) protein
MPPARSSKSSASARLRPLGTAVLATRWKLPSAIIDAINHHHGEDLAANSLAGVVSKADTFCVVNGLLPGYVVPPALGTQPEAQPEFAKLLKQVDALMDLVRGNPVGWRPGGSRPDAARRGSR